MKLYSYYRSSAAYRVRIALNLKQLPYEISTVHLLRNGGEQKTTEYAAVNPQQLVPTLEDKGLLLTQSLAIIEYLDEAYPKTPLLPADSAGRAKVRILSHLIACDVHPLNNLRVLQYLKNCLGVGEQDKNTWYAHWIRQGLEAFEQHLKEPSAGRFCYGDTPSMADCCLIPQLYNARRFQIDLSPYPNILRIEQECAGLPAFQTAAPENQPDAE
ncbi:MAG: maleylacetoacetate isomerase [Neisseria sp.]|nr:maleylacetoacetate isomerase [Neisseria sp.]